MAINIQKFREKYLEEYEALYNQEGEVAGYREAVQAFDEFVKPHQAFVGEFVKFHGDFISSDREAAAFMFALQALA